MDRSTSNIASARARGRRSVALLPVALVVLALALLGHPGEAAADKIPGMGSARYYYFTEKMDPIRVTFSTMRYDEPVPKPLTTIEIPRAYIYFTPHYGQDEYETLPEEIKVSQLGILLTYPDGLPYSAAIRKYRIAHGGSPGLAGKKLRQVLIKAQIHATAKRTNNLSYLRPRDEREPGFKSVGDLGVYEGMRRFSHAGSGEVYFGDADDEIPRIECRRAPEDAHARFFCTHYTVLNDRLIAKVQFVDFRANGGIEFVRERMRAFKRIVCPIFECGRVWND